MSAHVGKSLHLGEHTHEELTAAFDATMANWNLYLFDGFGSYDPDVIYNRIEYLASGLDCRIIFLDHLSILLSGLDGDERRMIDTTMTKLEIAGGAHWHSVVLGVSPQTYIIGSES